MYNFNDYYIGQTAELRRAFTREDVKNFADVSGDHNPIHLDEDFCRKTHFGRCIVHGPFICSVFGTLLSKSLPGPGTILVLEEYKFRRPAIVGGAVLFQLSISEINQEKHSLTLQAKCFNDQGEVLVEGRVVTKKIY